MHNYTPGVIHSCNLKLYKGGNYYQTGCRKKLTWKILIEIIFHCMIQLIEYKVRMYKCLPLVTFLSCIFLKAELPILSVPHLGIHQCSLCLHFLRLYPYHLGAIKVIQMRNESLFKSRIHTSEYSNQRLLLGYFSTFDQ